LVLAINRPPRTHSTRRGIAASASLAVLALAATLLAGCAPSGSESVRVKPVAQPVYPQVKTNPGIPVTENVVYGSADAAPLTLDICFPKAAADGTAEQGARPALLSVHGGSWRAGDKADVNWRAVCQWLASAGFVTFSVNYRLAPQHTFPAQIDDLRTAVRWVRSPDQVTRYNIDPKRVGVFGGSAGGNLAALLGTDGKGATSTGDRVAAVAELSGPTDLTAAGLGLGTTPAAFQQIELEYLGCASFGDCPQARAASPRYQVDSSDPPFFIGQSVDERIPKPQSDALVAALRKAGVDTTYVTVKGTRHSIAMLDDELRSRIVDFLHAHLGS
jgi:acetyl esterase/lipase